MGITFYQNGKPDVLYWYISVYFLVNLNREQSPRTFVARTTTKTKKYLQVNQRPDHIL
jgi:hypothetical protein